MAKDKTQSEKPKTQKPNRQFLRMRRCLRRQRSRQRRQRRRRRRCQTFERGLRRDLQTKCARSRLKPFICKPTAKNETENAERISRKKLKLIFADVVSFLCEKTSEFVCVFVGVYHPFQNYKTFEGFYFSNRFDTFGMLELIEG